MRVTTKRAAFWGGLAPSLLFFAVLSAFAQPAPDRPDQFRVRKIGRLGGPDASGVAGHGGNYSVLSGSRTYFFLNNLWTGEQGPGGSVWGIADSGLAWSTAAPAALPGTLSYLADENRWPLTVIPQEPGEKPAVRRLWPRSVHYRDGEFRVFYSVLHGLGSWPQENFRVGQGLAVSSAAEGPYKRLSAGGSTLFWNDLQPSFGAALLEDADGWVYLYGRGVTDPGKYAVFLARTRARSLGDPGKYSYYSADASSDWADDPQEATPVAEDWDEEFSVSFNRTLGRYLAVYCGREGRVMYAQARYPWGPWEKPAQLFACKPQDYCRGAKEHPALASDDGATLYVTVESRNVPYLYEVSIKAGDKK